MNVVEATRATLRELRRQHDPSEVAELLRLVGVRGRPLSPIGCPVANYVRWRARVLNVKVTSRGVFVFVGEAWQHVEALPRPVFEFVRRFDEGAYPDLRADLTTSPEAST